MKLEWVDKCDSNALATTEFFEAPSGNFFRIRLSLSRLSDVPLWALLDTVCHEYGHALAWTEAHTNLKDHGGLWGVAYAMAYQIWIGEVK